MVHSNSWGEMRTGSEENPSWGGSGSREGPRTGQIMRSLTGSLKGMLGSSSNLVGMLDSSVHRPPLRSESSRHGR